MSTDDSFRRTLVGLKLVVHLKGVARLKRFRRTLVGLKRAVVVAESDEEEFQTNPRGVEAAARSIISRICSVSDEPSWG